MGSVRTKYVVAVEVQSDRRSHFVECYRTNQINAIDGNLNDAKQKLISVANWNLVRWVSWFIFFFFRECVLLFAANFRTSISYITITIDIYYWTLTQHAHHKKTRVYIGKSIIFGKQKENSFRILYTYGVHACVWHFRIEKFMIFGQRWQPSSTTMPATTWVQNENNNKLRWNTCINSWRR